MCGNGRCRYPGNNVKILVMNAYSMLVWFRVQQKSTVEMKPVFFLREYVLE